MQSESEKAVEEPELDAASLDAIRNLMAGEDEADEPPAPLPARASAAEKVQAEQTHESEVAPAPVLPPRKADGLPDLTASPPVVPQAKAPGKSRVGRLASTFRRNKPKAKPKAKAKAVTKTAVASTTARPKSALMLKVDEVKAKVLAYRPTRKHILWGSFALLVLLRPWLVVGLLFLSVFVLIGVFLVLGYDGFWRRAMAIGRWHARRNPERSVELHKRLDQFAVKWDAVLDRFPEGSVDGLYLPDFGDIAEADARHDEAMERRLSSLQQTEA